MKGFRKAEPGRLLSLPQLIRQLRAQSASMRRRLFRYLFALILVGSGILLVVLIGIGAFTENSRGLAQSLNLQLDNWEERMKEQLDFFIANGISLSERLASSLERESLSYPYDIRECDDDAERLSEMQKNIYPLVENTLYLTRTSGVFAVFDATVNTALPDAEHSRSGIYLRVGNVSSGNALKNDIFLFRGSVDVALQYHLQLHNRWNMEFDTRQFDWYETQLAGGQEMPEYLCIDRHRVKGTWENGIFLSMPVNGNDGENYGLCGLEITNQLFSLSYPVAESHYGDMVAVFVPLSGNQLLLSNGLVGETGASYLDENRELHAAGREGKLSVYSDGIHSYFGVYRTIEGLRDSSGRQWAIAALLNRRDYRVQTQRQRAKVFAAVLTFFLIMIFCSFVLAHRFVQPIVQDLEGLKTDPEGSQGASRIREIEELEEFLRTWKQEKNGDREKTAPALPPNVEKMFDSFIARVRTLTAAEKNILQFYIAGYEIADIPGLAYISMNTVRKHNRSIYKKLGVSSRDELLTYLNLLERCERLRELE